jgi:hypothetical protein
VFVINLFYRGGEVDSTPISAEDDPQDRDIRNLIKAAEQFNMSRRLPRSA